MATRYLYVGVRVDLYFLSLSFPSCLQLFNRIRWFVLWASLFSFLQGFIVNGVINAVVTSLETRFELPSTRSGLIPSSNNFIALVVVLLITYYGAGPSKPRIIAAGVLLVALGSLIFSLPHFITGLYVYRSSGMAVGVHCHRLAVEHFAARLLAPLSFAQRHHFILGTVSSECLIS